MTLPSVIVEIGFSNTAAGSPYLHLDDATLGLLDTGQLAATIWEDVSQWVQGFTVDRGSRRVDGPVVRYEAGSLSLALDNTDRRFDPTNLAGPYVSGGVTQIKPMREIRVRADWAGVVYDLFRGFVDSWLISYSEAGNWSEVSVTATDAFKVIGNYDRAAGAAVGAGEDSGARVNRILDSISWSSLDRTIATGNSPMQATTLADNTLTELLLTADSEIGELYVAGNGKVVFRNRRAVLEDARSSTSQATFDDADGATLDYDDVGIEYDDTQLINLVRIAREGGTQQSAQDAASQDEYLVHTFERTDLMLDSDTATADYAAYVLFQSKDPELRFTHITIEPQGDSAREAAVWPQALGRQIGDRVTVKRTPPGGGSVITRDVFIRGIRHEVSRTNDMWTITWQFQSATKHAFLVLDHASLGVLDSNALAF